MSFQPPLKRFYHPGSGHGRGGGVVSGNVRRRFDNGQEYPGAQSGRDSNSISHDHDVSDIDSGPARAAVRDDGDASAPNFDADGFAGPPEFPDREIAVLPCRGVAGFDIGRVIAAEDAYHADNGIAESDDEASDHDDDVVLPVVPQAAANAGDAHAANGNVPLEAAEHIAGFRVYSGLGPNFAESEVHLRGRRRKNKKVRFNFSAVSHFCSPPPLSRLISIANLYCCSRCREQKKIGTRGARILAW